MAKFSKRIEAMILDLATDPKIDKLHQDNRAKAAALRLKRRQQWERMQAAIRIKRQRDDALIAFSVRVIPPKDKQGDRFNRELQNASAAHRLFYPAFLQVLDSTSVRQRQWMRTSAVLLPRSGVVLDSEYR